MAKAADEANTTWILLRAALALVIDAFQDPKSARSWLQQQLEKGYIRWRYWVVERGLGPPLVLSNAELGEPSAWRWHGPATRSFLPKPVVLTIDWTQSAIHRAGEGGRSRVELAREDILARLPQGLVAEPRQLPERHADPQGDQKRTHPQGDRVEIALRAEFPPDGRVPPPSGTKRWIHEFMQHHPDADAREVWENRPDAAAGIKLKTVQNQVSEYRKLPGLSQKFPKSSRKR